MCRCSSRKFSSTFSRLPPALTTTSGWSFKPSLEYVQVGYFPAEKIQVLLQRIEAFLPKRHFGFTPTWSLWAKTHYKFVISDYLWLTKEKTFPGDSCLYILPCVLSLTRCPECGGHLRELRLWLECCKYIWAAGQRPFENRTGSRGPRARHYSPSGETSLHLLLSGVIFVTSFRGPERWGVHKFKSGRE